MKMEDKLLGCGLLAASVGSFLLLRNSVQDENSRDSITVSCPGKVLLAGGYLVLEAPNVALTVSTTSRFYTTIFASSRQKKGDEASVTGSLLRIAVQSPQLHEDYLFLYDPKTSTLRDQSATRNAFVEKCLLMTLSFIQEHCGVDFLRQVETLSECGGLTLRLQAHNDFYSQISRLQEAKKPLLSSSLAALPPFLPCPTDADGRVLVAKTGLGSSAALVTSLLGALLQFFGVVRLEESKAHDKDVHIVHNLAQLVHSHAQGKIGSGFDVSAAVFGSQIYRRFNQTVFLPCLEEAVSPAVLRSFVLEDCLWTQTTESFQLPPMVNLLLGDVCGGSSSSSMARAVLEFRKSNPTIAEVLWNDLAETNLKIGEAVTALSTLSQQLGEVYSKRMQWVSEHLSAEWSKVSEQCEVCHAVVQIRSLFEKARRLLKQLGTESGVEIEPDGQSALLQASLMLPGVIAGAVPGAGGHDAVFVLAVGEHSRRRVEELWSTWASSADGRATVCALQLRAATGDHQGIQLEKRKV